MKTDSPFNSPSLENISDVSLHPLRQPYPWTAILLLVGGIFSLLLNGQFFTNALIFLSFAVISGALWIVYYLRTPLNCNRHQSIYVLIAHAAILIALCWTLPAKYQRQQKFNQGAKKVLERLREKADVLKL